MYVFYKKVSKRIYTAGKTSSIQESLNFENIGLIRANYSLNWLNCGYKWYFGSSRIVIFYLLKSFKANNGGSITNIIEICEHPDWKKKITHLFSMHNGRNPLLNDRLFEELKDNTKAESGKVDAFLKTGSIVYSF